MKDIAEPTFDPITYINTPRWRVSHLGLDRIRELLRRMGNPQDHLRFVHVAGTNGKGSVCAFVAETLVSAGYRTGLFTSPYIEKFEERIRVDGVNITYDELVRATLSVREYACEVEEVCGEHPTEFELMFAVALEHFRAMKCDIVVCEVGLGGRLDATNAIDRPEVSVITRIGLDHTDILGDTLEDIAFEKAGIIKYGVPVVTWPHVGEIAEVIDSICDTSGCVHRQPDFEQLKVEPLVLPEASALSSEYFDPVRHFSYRNHHYTTHLLGNCQAQNAALAIEVIEQLRACGWDIANDALASGIDKACLPGRFEVIGFDPLTIVDGAHNPQGAYSLAQTLAELTDMHAEMRVVFVMSVLADKNYPEMIRAVLPFARAFITCEPQNDRALDAEVLACAIEDEIAFSEDDLSDASTITVEARPTSLAAMSRARESAGTDDIVVAFGSLYSVAAMTDAVKALRA